MKPYITTDDAVEILSRMMHFENDLRDVYGKWNYDFRENLGRRNALVSMSQETETARVLQKKFKRVVSDGAPGKPDIFIEDLNAELECKLTSGNRSRNRMNFDFKTDWETINVKEKIDYIYILANEDFDSFAFLFFEGLTPADFFYPASGSRGKSRMNKSKGMRKCTPLFGSFTNNCEEQIKKINIEIETTMTNRDSRLQEIMTRPVKTPLQRSKNEKILEGEKNRFANKIGALSQKVESLKSRDNFTFNLAKL